MAFCILLFKSFERSIAIREVITELRLSSSSVCFEHSALGRHELHTSDTLGAAAVRLGPNLAASMAIMNKELGLTHGKVKRLLAVLFGLTIPRSTSVCSMLRTSARVQPALTEIQALNRGSPVIQVDETDWKQSGLFKWLHVIVSPRAALDSIESRGREVLQS